MANIITPIQLQVSSDKSYLLNTTQATKFNLIIQHVIFENRLVIFLPSDLPFSDFHHSPKDFFDCSDIEHI
jgi:hypothetical protein